MRLGDCLVRWVRGIVVTGALVGAGSAGAATLVVDQGRLLGATGVDVGGTFYDVSFLDGTCVALFGGCDSADDFAFSSQTAAIAAANALIDQVYLDTPAGNFNSVPALTSGCGTTNCFVRIPYDAVGSGLFFVYSLNGATFNSVFIAGGSTATDTATTEFEVYAVFALPSVSPVPVPAALPLLMGGLGLLGLVGRRRRG